MAEKPKGRWAEGASDYRPGSATARGGARATRPWHVDARAGGGEGDQPAPAFARTLPVAALEADPEQPRRSFDEAALAELAASVREQGVLQPLVVRRLPGSQQRYVVVAGERRLRAARMAGLEEVPCMVLAGASLRDARLAQLAENLQREDLAPMEEAHAVVRLAEVEALSHEELARRLGKSPAYISRIFSISRIPAEEYDDLATSKPGASLLYEYAQLPADPPLRARARALVRDGATVRDLEALRGRGGRRRAAAAPRRGRPAKARAEAEALARAVRALEALGPEAARALGPERHEEILAAGAALARWSAAAVGDAGLAEAARALEAALTRASAARSSTPAGRAGRGGRKARTSRPR